MSLRQEVDGDVTICLSKNLLIFFSAGSKKSDN